MVMRNFRLLEQALEDIERHGRPRIPGPVRTLPNGQVSAQVFPVDVFDRIFYSGVTAETWMEPGVTVASLPETQAVAYHDPQGTARPGAVCLVLGAGNVSSIGPMDALYKLFVEDQVVLYKTHPVNAFLGPLLEEGFRALIEGSFLRVVYGGAEEGAYLCQHPAVDEIHITGSDRTYEALVFGPGEEGQRRKERGETLLAKRVTAELGNVSPVIVVPGPWSDKDYDFHGQSLATMLVNNAGFNCNATRVIVNQAGWPGRERLLGRVREVLSRVPPRHAYYPGAADRFQAFLAAHPEAERFGGEGGDGHLPWALIPGVDPSRQDDICYTTEAFTGVFSETALHATGPVDYLRKAVAFCNETLWGSLNVTLIVHPRSLRNPEVATAVEQAIADLRYGTVSLNQWAAIGYGLVVTPWGAFPGHEPHDIQSGVGFVHNTLMFSRIQKTVVRCPFRVWPKPVWFTTHRTAHRLTPLLTKFESGPSFAKLPAITRWVLGG